MMTFLFFWSLIGIAIAAGVGRKMPGMTLFWRFFWIMASGPMIWIAGCIMGIVELSKGPPKIDRNQEGAQYTLRSVLGAIIDDVDNPDGTNCIRRDHYERACAALGRVAKTNRTNTNRTEQ